MAATETAEARWFRLMWFCPVSTEAVQELQRGFLRQLCVQRPAITDLHPPRDCLHRLLLPAAAAVRVGTAVSAEARTARRTLTS